MIFKSVFRRWIIPSTSKYVFYDKLYSVIHESKHNTNHSMSIQDRLISDAHSIDIKHNAFTIPMHENEDIMICLKYQYNYFKLYKNARIKYVKQCEHKSLWKRYIEDCQCLTTKYQKFILLLHLLILLVRVYIMFGFPLYWFIYRYLDEINGYRVCDATTPQIKCIQNVFVTVIFIAYWILMIIFCGSLLSMMRYEHIFGYICGLDDDTEYSCQGFTIKYY